MQNNTPDPLPIAVRAYPQPEKREPIIRANKKWRRAKGMLVFDTETRTDPTQSLTFGSYLLISGSDVVEEGIFYGDDLPDADLQVLQNYVATNQARIPRNVIIL